ncbi:hypothetical protein HYT25_03825 [Candidatus Pacearchaeota archaeon]|nr:hypothetical protein [Candidatus Pacearchaeota archaeon]
MDERIDLELFVNTYIGCALMLAGNNGGISSDDFDNELRRYVAKEMNISQDFVKFLHHPFHWTFFTDGRYGFKSPFEYNPPAYKGETAKIKLKRDVSEEDKSKLVEHVLSNYRALLNERIRISTSHRQF